MDKKSHNKDINILPGNEIDPDELVHEQEIIPNEDEAQDVDDLVHEVTHPTMNEQDNELDIDDLVHDAEESSEWDSPASEGQ